MQHYLMLSRGNFYAEKPYSNDGTGSGFLTRDPTRPDPVSSLNDVKFRNVVTSQGQSARK